MYTKKEKAVKEGSISKEEKEGVYSSSVLNSSTFLMLHKRGRSLSCPPVVNNETKSSSQPSHRGFVPSVTFNQETYDIIDTGRVLGNPDALPSQIMAPGNKPKLPKEIIQPQQQDDEAESYSSCLTHN